MLTQMRDQFRAQGYESEMNALAVSVQLGNTEEEKASQTKLVADYGTKAENCYRSAEELSAALAKLPKPKKDK